MRLNKNIQKISDEELVGLARGNPEFFVHIVERYEDRILRYIKRISNLSHESAEDMAQETFIKSYLKLNQFDSKLKFSAWIYRIAHNHVISFWRATKKDKNVIYWDQGDHYEKILESDEDLMLLADRKLLEKKMAVVLSQLKPVHKEVLVLKYLEDKDYNEISDILERPVGSIGILLLRAKAEMKKKINLKKI